MDGKSHSAFLVEKVMNGEQNPFHAIEALGEHVGACWGALHRMGLPVWEQIETKPFRNYSRPKGSPGDIIYHLNAIKMYEQEVFNLMAALLPELYAASDGDPEALARMKKQLEELRDFHQRRWEAY